MKNREQLMDMLRHVESAYKREASMYNLSGMKESKENMKWYEGQIIALNFALGNNLMNGLGNQVPMLA